MPPYDKNWQVEWNDGDRAWLASVLSGESGRKLWRTLQNEVGEVAIWATNRKDSVRACGYAAGVAYIVKLIEACLPQPKQVVPSEEEDYSFENSMLDQ